MARAGDEIVNPRTGQRMVFLETGKGTDGQLVRIDTFNPPSPPLEGKHVHPFQESGAEVLSGSLCFSVGGEQRSVKPGESITIPANTPHFFWNDGDQEAHAVQWFRPALKTDQFFETFFGLAQDDKLTAKGLPSLLQIAVMMPRFGDEIRLASPPWKPRQINATYICTPVDGYFTSAYSCGILYFSEGGRRIKATRFKRGVCLGGQKANS